MAKVDGGVKVNDEQSQRKNTRRVAPVNTRFNRLFSFPPIPLSGLLSQHDDSVQSYLVIQIYLYMRFCLSALLAIMCSVVIRHINTPHPRSHTHITAPTCSISGQYAYAVPHARCSHRTISKMERTRGVEKGKGEGRE